MNERLIACCLVDSVQSSLQLTALLKIFTGATRNSFWDFREHTMTQLRLVFTTLEVNVLIDGNVRLGSVVSPSIGRCDCAKGSSNGMAR